MLVVDRFLLAPDTRSVESDIQPSIAVLPFVDMSPNKDQEYFSDGVAEELLNQLTKLHGLHVAGRTSSFSFKGREEDLRVIGDRLNVANILEGSAKLQESARTRSDGLHNKSGLRNFFARRRPRARRSGTWKKQPG